MGSEEDAWRMFRSALALRRGKGRDYLVLGRMERPARLDGIAAKTWIEAGRQHSVPAVFHSAWRSPAGKFAVVAANWTAEDREVRVHDQRFGRRCLETLSAGKGLTSREREAEPAGIQISLPGLSCVLIEMT
jgi:hypothetical protein